MSYNPDPPYDLTPVAGSSNIVLGIFTVLAIGMLAYAALDWRKRGYPLVLAICVGAICTNPIEGIADHLGFVWYTDIDQAVWYRSFVPMPMWMLPAYILFFASLTVTVLKFIESNSPRTAFVKAAMACWLLNLAIEVPLRKFTDVYIYYGDNQPLSVGGFPLYWLVLNSGAPIIVAVVLYKFRAFFTGWRLLFVLPLMPVTYGAFLAGAGWPIFNLLHSTAPQWIIELGALATCALGLTAYWIVMELVSSDGRWSNVYRRQEPDAGVRGGARTVPGGEKEPASA